VVVDVVVDVDVDVIVDVIVVESYRLQAAYASQPRPSGVGSTPQAG
jgi:hypothetical protein